MTDRMRNYKFNGRDSESARSRRRENTVELRRNKVAEQMLKRRNIVVDTTNPLTPSLSENSKPDNSKAITLAVLPSLMQNVLNGQDKVTVFDAVQGIRKLLSKEKFPPVEDVINGGIVAKLVHFLTAHEHPDLQYEAAWCLTNIASGESHQTMHVVECNALPALIPLLASTNGDVQDQAIWCLGNIAGDGPQLRDFCIQAGLVHAVIQVIQSGCKVEMLRNATWTLSNLCRGKKPFPNYDAIKPTIPVFIHLVQHEDDDVASDACWALTYITDSGNSAVQDLIDAGGVQHVTKMLSSRSSRVQLPAVRTLGNIATGDAKQTQTIVDEGALSLLVNVIDSHKETVRKEVCWAVSNVTAGTEEQGNSVIRAGLIPPIIKCLEEGEYRTRKEATWALCNMINDGTNDQLSYVISQGVIAPLVQMLDGRDSQIITLVLESVEKMLEAGRPLDDVNPCATWIEEAGGLELIEELQNHEDDTIYEKALEIIETYFGEDGDADVLESGNAFAVAAAQPVTAGGFNF